MADVAGLVLPFFGMIFLGFLAARLSRQPIEALGWMSVFIFYVAQPAMFFQLLSQTPVEQLTALDFVGGSLLATVLVFATMFVGSLLLAGNIAESTIKALASSYGNIGFMGPGLALIAFGPEAAVPVALIFCFENMLHFIVTPTLMAMAGGGSERGWQLVLGIARRILLHPFILATAAGFGAAWFELSAPAALDRLLALLAGAAAPCALFAMGVTLALRPLKRLPAAIVPITLLKLVVHPLLCYAILTAIGGFSPIWIYSAVLLAALPSATNVYVLAQQYGVWVERGSASVLVTTVCSVVTVTALLYAINAGLLPTGPFG